MMPSDFLQHLYYVQLDASTWCAVATLNVQAYDDGKNKREQQRYGVRLLLTTLLDMLFISDTLDESRFPYRLVTSQYYVSFSHSKDKVAVAIGRNRPVGVDIETNLVKWLVAKRFFHQEECALLATMDDSERDRLSTWGWQLKESFIKVHQYKLAQGLGINYASLITRINDRLKEDYQRHQVTRIDDTVSDYHVAVLIEQQVIVVY